MGGDVKDVSLMKRKFALAQKKMELERNKNERQEKYVKKLMDLQGEFSRAEDTTEVLKKAHKIVKERRWEEVLEELDAVMEKTADEC